MPPITYACDHCDRSPTIAVVPVDARSGDTKRVLQCSRCACVWTLEWALLRRGVRCSTRRAT